MTPLLKSLLGNGSKDRELTEEMRAVVNQMQEERARCEAFIQSAHDASDRLQQLDEPIARAAGVADGIAARLADLEQRLTSIAQVSNQLQSLQESAGELMENQRRADAQVAGSVENAQRIRTVFEELSQKVDVALELKTRLESFLEVEKPFQQLRGDGETIRQQVEGTGEQLARLREQHDRLIDAHKLAMSRMEALDHRRDVLGRELTDKERRIANVEQAVRGMDGVQNKVDEVRREIGTLKALGDGVVQKTAALEAQREAVERALAEAQHLDRARQQIDAGVRQQQENEKTLGALQDQVAALRSLHEAVLERSSEISQFQRETDELTQATRQDLTAMMDEMKKTVDRFDFEGRALESVTQRVADLRSALSECEHRFKGLAEPSRAVGELQSRSEALGTHLQTLSDEVGKVDQEMTKFRAIRRDLDETGRTAHEIVAQVGQIEEGRPAIEAAARDFAQLAGAHAMVKDALEQTQVAHDEIARVRESQSETRSWLDNVEQSVAQLKDQVGEVHKMAPTIEVVQKQAQRLGETTTAIEARREFVDDLHRRMNELVALGKRLDERDRQLHTRMEAAEQRFVGLAGRAEEAEGLSTAVANVSTSLSKSERKTDEIGKAVASIVARCESVEELGEQTRALRPELEQRQHALTEATKDLQRASALRKEAAVSAQKLDETAKRLTAALATADRRAAVVEELSTQLEERAANLSSVEKRLGQFEQRLAKWDPVEKEIARSLEQISTRQGTVEALQADLDRMFAMVEKTATDVREITSAKQEIEQSRKLLAEVMGRLQEVRDTASSLDERNRQMGKAEERLARADALLVEVRSSLESLQGQKAIVDQAVEKTGSLQFLLKQAEATIEGLKEEREMTARVHAAVAVIREDDDEEHGEHAKGMAKAA
jgi:chromosome segregation ATPase